MYDGLWTTWVPFFCTLRVAMLDELDGTHFQELLDHRIGSEHNLSLLHLHRCPAMKRGESVINQ